MLCAPSLIIVRLFASARRVVQRQRRDRIRVRRIELRTDQPHCRNVGDRCGGVARHFRHAVVRGVLQKAMSHAELDRKISQAALLNASSGSRAGGCTPDLLLTWRSAKLTASDFGRRAGPTPVTIR